METAFVVGNMFWNAGLVGVAGYLTKRWMDKVDARAETVQVRLRETADSLAKDLKETVAEHREELKDQSDKIDTNLNKIYDQLRIANGRTAKLEGKIETQRAICEERHG